MSDMWQRSKPPLQPPNFTPRKKESELPSEDYRTNPRDEYDPMEMQPEKKKNNGGVDEQYFEEMLKQLYCHPRSNEGS